MRARQIPHSTFPSIQDAIKLLSVHFDVKAVHYYNTMREHTVTKFRPINVLFSEDVHLLNMCKER